MPVRFQVDPDFYDHPKTAGMSDTAFSLWVRAGSFSVAKLTDGFITEAVLVHTLRSDAQVADELVERGLWRRRRGGYVFHQWEPRNLTRQRVEDHNRAEAKRKREERQRLNRQAGGVDPATDGLSGETQEKNSNDQLINNPSRESQSKINTDGPLVRGHHVRPDMTRTPDGVQPESNTVGVGVGVVFKDGYVALGSPVDQRARDDQRPEAAEIPDDWKPHDGHRALAAQRGLNLDHEASRFRDHALDKGRISQNWSAAFSNWLGNSGVGHGTRLRVVNGGTEPHRDPKTGRAVEW